jgi:hypothetical protein
MLLGESQQSFASPSEALTHYGVKGQRKGHGTPKRIDRKNGRDPKRLAILYGRRRGKKEPLDVQHKMAEHINQRVEDVNDKYSNADFSNVDWGNPKSWDEQARLYHDEVLALTAESNRVAVKNAYGVTPTDKRKAELSPKGDRILLREVQVKHAAEDEVVATFKVARDIRGLIISVQPVEDEEDPAIVQTIDRGRAFLEHYGVKGMRWGVRKGQSGSGDKAGIEPATLIGIAYVAAFLGSIGASIYGQYKDSGKKIQKQNANVPWKKNANLAKKAPPMTVDSLHKEVVMAVNKDYPKNGTKMNCRRATFTYEMRRRGYDVTSTKSRWATGQDLEGVKNATMTKSKEDRKRYESTWGEKQVMAPREFSQQTAERKSELIFNSLNKYPDGARGELAVGWQFGGGHSMAFEKVRGQAVIFDTQTRDTYRKPADFAKFAEITHDAAHTRTDNAKLDEQFLRRWMVNND